MEHSEACEVFFKLEQSLDLFSWKINDIYIWERIRFQIFNLLMNELGIYGQAHSKTNNSFGAKIHLFLSSIYNYTIKNPFFAKPKDYIFIGHERRKLLKDNLYWDIYCDFFLDNIDNALLLEPYYLNSHLRPPKTRNIYYLDIVSLVSYFKIKIFKDIKLSLKDKQSIIAAGAHFYDIFHVNIELNKIICKDLSNHYAKFTLYKKLFKKIQPKIIFVVVSYGKETLIHAAKALKIPVVELQHGIISKYHMGYSFPHRQIKHTFPDYFFSFGKYWAQEIQFPIKKEKIYNIGYPYLEESLKRYDKKKSDTFVFISQWSIGENLSRFAVQFRKNTPNNIKIIYKLHPGEFDRWRKAYPWLIGSDIEVLDSDIPTLYAILAKSKWQAGVYSTAIYEGLAFGCQTYLVNLPGVETMDKLIRSGYATLIKTPEEINLTYHKNNSLELDYFYKSNSIYNFRTTIQEKFQLNL